MIVVEEEKGVVVVVLVEVVEISSFKVLAHPPLKVQISQIMRRRQTKIISGQVQRLRLFILKFYTFLEGL